MNPETLKACETVLTGTLFVLGITALSIGVAYGLQKASRCSSPSHQDPDPEQEELRAHGATKQARNRLRGAREETR